MCLQIEAKHVSSGLSALQYVAQNYALDGVLTLVDAKHIGQHLDERKPEGVVNEALSQVAYADRIILNKTDLVRFLSISTRQMPALAILYPGLILQTPMSW